MAARNPGRPRRTTHSQSYPRRRSRYLENPPRVPPDEASRLRPRLTSNSTNRRRVQMKNWKTTLLGILAGIAMVFGSAAQARSTDPAAPPITIGNLLPGIAVAVLGAVAKDHDVT